MKAVVVERRDEADVLAARRAGKALAPSETLKIRSVELPEVGYDEVLLEVFASSINYNTIWTAKFEPVSTFSFLDKYAAKSTHNQKHQLPYHIVGSDASGIVRRVGDGVDHWKVGDEVVAHCLVVGLESPDGHDDALLDPDQKIWGYETNFGGLAEFALVKANQLLKKAPHLTWEESASTGLVCSTAYRQLVSRNGANLKQGDFVLIWGAVGGLGSYACQFALNGGGYPIAVVSGEERVRAARALGVEMVIDRQEKGYRFLDHNGNSDVSEWQRLRRDIRALSGGRDPDIVFEHSGRETFGASVFVARRGGVIVTCASTSGFWHEYDNRYLWMNVKRIVGTHFANYREASQANDLVIRGAIVPTLTDVYPIGDVGKAADLVAQNQHVGKLGILCASVEPGQGVSDHELRSRLFPPSRQLGLLRS